MRRTSLRPSSFRQFWAAGAMLAMLLATFALGIQAAQADNAAEANDPQNDPWPDIARDAFDGRPMADGTGVLAIEMPYRAEDAAIVPVTLRLTLPPEDTRRVRAVTLVVDENPAPVAATFTFGPNAAVAAISTRLRVNSYTNVHAVAELSDDKLYVVKTYVKASGGCSAPAAKSAEDARNSLGQMRLRQFAQPSGAPASRWREVQLMIRHPNNSGLQMDQVTRLYVPAFFVQHAKVWQGDDLILAVDGGISLSEDPNIRFSYRPNGAGTLRAEVLDTEKHVFKGEWPVERSQM
jgi:sulfur-oxidizing protein SoxY